MKSIYLMMLLILVGCDQLVRGQQQPVKTLNNNMYFTSCSGAVEHWASCNNKAQATCQKGYSVVRQNENATGTVRELIFECKK